MVSLVNTDSRKSASGADLTAVLGTHAAGQWGIIYAFANGVGGFPNLEIAESGWVRHVHRDETANLDAVQALFSKKLTSAAENDPVMTTSNSNDVALVLWVLDDVDDAGIEVITDSGTASNTYNGTNPAITTLSDDSAVFLCHGSSGNGITAVGVPSTPSGLVAGPETIGWNDRQITTAYKLNAGAQGLITPSAWQNTGSTTTEDTKMLTFAVKSATGVAEHKTYVNDAQVDKLYFEDTELSRLYKGTTRIY